MMGIDPVGGVSLSGSESGFGLGSDMLAGSDFTAVLDAEIRQAGGRAEYLRLADGSAYFRPGIATDVRPPVVPTEPSAPSTLPRVPLGPAAVGIAGGALATGVGVVVDQHAQSRMQQILSGEDRCGGRFFCFSSMLDGSFGGPAPLVSPLGSGQQSDPNALPGGPTAPPDSLPGPDTPQQGLAIETRSQEERNLVDSMLAEGKTADEIQNALNELRAGRGDIVNLIHQRSLGLNPATNQFNAGEAATALRLEAHLNRRLTRDPSGDADWIDSAGRTYDAVGPVPDQHFDAAAFSASVGRHLRQQGLDYVVVDATGMNAGNITQIDRYLQSLPADQARRIIRLGF
jgi:hypothetical protein